jgi:hypothetical protein
LPNIKYSRKSGKKNNENHMADSIIGMLDLCDLLPVLYHKTNNGHQIIITTWE